MSKVTFWPSASVDSPARSTAEMCTNTSLPPLDWQMWFAAYRSVAENAWFEGLTQQLLKGSPAVLALLAGNPFPNLPPNFQYPPPLSGGPRSVKIGDNGPVDLDPDLSTAAFSDQDKTQARGGVS